VRGAARKGGPYRYSLFGSRPAPAWSGDIADDHWIRHSWNPFLLLQEIFYVNIDQPTCNMLTRQSSTSGLTLPRGEADANGWGMFELRSNATGPRSCAVATKTQSDFDISEMFMLYGTQRTAARLRIENF
jgi:hypothetical protein